MATLYLDVESDAVRELAKIDKAFRRTGKNAERVKKQFRGGFNIKMPNLNAATAMLGSFTRGLREAGRFAGAAANNFLAINSQLEQMEIMLSTAQGSLAGGKQAMFDILELATKAPFSVQAIADSFVKLKTAGIENVTKTVVTLMDAVAAFGGSSEQLKLVSIAVQQMVGKGVISMEELRRQFGEQVPTAIRAMASELEMNILDMMDMIGTGGLLSDKGIPALMKGLDKLHKGAAAKRMQSFEGAVISVKNEWTKLMKALGDSNGAFKGVTEAIRKFGEAIGKFRTSSKGMEIIADVSDKIQKAMQDFIDDPNILYEIFASMAEGVKLVIKPLQLMFETLNWSLLAMDMIAGKLNHLSSSDWKGIDVGMDYAKVRSELIELNELKKELVDNTYAGMFHLPNPVEMFNDLKQIIEDFATLGELKPQFSEEDTEAAIRKIRERMEKTLGAPLDLPKAEIIVEPKFITDNRALLIAMGEVDNEINAIIDSYAQLSESMAEKNQVILEGQQELANELREIAREGMSDEGAYEDQLAQIKEYQKLAREAAKSGKSNAGEEQLRYLEKARDLIRSLDTSGISKMVTEADVDRARRYFNQISKATRGGKVADPKDRYGKALAEYNKLKNAQKNGEIEILSAAEQRATKMNELKTTGEAILDITRNSLAEDEKKKQSLEDQLAAMKGKLEELAGATGQYSDGVVALDGQWRQVGDVFTRIHNTMIDEFDTLIDRINTALKAMDELQDKGGSVNSNVPARALGGPVSQNQPYLIGEKGPELFVPSVHGRIIPNNELGNKRTVNLNLAIGGSEPVELQGTPTNVDKLLNILSDRERFAA